MSVREAAHLLNVSTKTIYRWVGDGRIPGYRVHKQYRFDRSELLEWATAQRIAVTSPVPLDPGHRETPIPPLDQAIEAGGIHYRVEGSTRDEVLRAAVTALRLVEEPDRELLFQALCAREDLASTSVGGGFALPHLRNPLRLEIRRPSVSLCFLEGPVPWGAPDGGPVDTLFVVVGATVREVLQLHSQVIFALRDEGFRGAVRGHGSRESILGEARRLAATFEEAATAR